MLSLCLKSTAQFRGSLRADLMKRGLFFGSIDSIKHIGFWIRLCQAASLLDEQDIPYPTLFVRDWLSLPYQDQITSLLEAWQDMPPHTRHQTNRSKLLQKLTAGEGLSPAEQKELYGLEALGICEGDDLTVLGYKLMVTQSVPISTVIPEPWEIEDATLKVPFPPSWELLWDLEHYLSPIDPGIYPLDDLTLRMAKQRGKGQKYDQFLCILERGLKSKVPHEITRFYRALPIIKPLIGAVFEFSSSQELVELRKNRSLRRQLNKVISPHHVFTDLHEAEVIAKKLFRRGLLSKEDLFAFTLNQSYENQVFSISERAYLLSLFLVLENMPYAPTAPPGILNKLTKGLTLDIRGASARQAIKTLSALAPPQNTQPEKELPASPDPQVVIFINQAIQAQEPIDFRYIKAQSYRDEQRRVTPLLLEQRGLRFYLIGFCHQRKANRTFRLDRMKLIPPPACPDQQ